MRGSNGLLSSQHAAESLDNPFEVLETARRLYGFLGEALLCRIPAGKFEAGEGLTPRAEEAARSAAKLVGEQLSALISQHRHE